MNETYILRGLHARRQHDHFIKEHYFLVETLLVIIDTQFTRAEL
jgi:hypothetical protein